MTYTTQSLYEQKVESIAKELRDEGYAVVIEPAIADLPFDLGRYQPDLIATKNDGGIVLEIRTSLKRLSVDRLQEISKQISEQKGWRFMLVTLDDAFERALPSDESDLPSWEQLNSQLTKLDTLIQSSLIEPAILFAWSVLEAALRKRAMHQHLPIERFPTQPLLDHMYSSGEISISEFDLFKPFLEVRNRVAHGTLTTVDPELLRSESNAIKDLVKAWEAQS